MVIFHSYVSLPEGTLTDVKSPYSPLPLLICKALPNCVTAMEAACRQKLFPTWRKQQVADKRWQEDTVENIIFGCFWMYLVFGFKFFKVSIFSPGIPTFRFFGGLAQVCSGIQDQLRGSELSLELEVPQSATVRDLYMTLWDRFQRPSGAKLTIEIDSCWQSAPVRRSQEKLLETKESLAVADIWI